MRCGEAAAPPGSIVGGRVIDQAAVAQTLRTLIARTEITTPRALVAVSDAIASFRLLTFPDAANRSAIDRALGEQFDLGSDRMARRHVTVRRRGGEQMVFAVTWERAQVEAAAGAARMAGLEPAVVDLKSLCVARPLVVDACLFVDLSTDPCEVLVIDERLPRIWHTFKLEPGADPAPGIARGLRSALELQRRLGAGADAPIVVRADQELPSSFSDRLESLTGHPVEGLSQPLRSDPDVRYGPYLTCLGLIMRRKA